jgi:predicted metal-binding protein
MTRPTAPVELLVCTRCRRGQEIPEDGERPGAVFFRRLSETAIDGVTVTPVECLSNCSQGCTIALRGRDRWTYVYGRFDEAHHVETVRDGAVKYAKTPDGLVPWRERPEHFRKNCIARLPPLDAA